MKIDLYIWRERRWIVGPAAVVFAGNLAFFLASRAVDGRRAASLEEGRRAAHSRFEAAEKDRREAEEQSRHLKNVRLAAREFYARQIGSIDETMAATVEEIHRVCRRAKVNPHRIGYSAAPLHDVPLVEMKISFNVGGDYHTLRQLLRGFEEDDRWIVVRSAELTRKEESVGEGEIRLTVATYFSQNGNAAGQIAPASGQKSR